MIETALDDCVAYGFTSVPAYNTQIVTLDGGIEQRNGNWTKAKRRFSALYQNFTPANFALLLACFHACRGALYPFLFKDHSDYAVTGGALGTTPGANTTPIQLVKVYTFGSQTTTRTILKPRSGTVTVYQNGVAKAGVISLTTGLFTPTTNWAAGATLTGTFEFYVPVRFATDEFPSTYENVNAISTTCELVEEFI